VRSREDEGRLVNYGVELLQWFISQGLVEADPVGAPLTVQALSGGYSQDEHGLPVKDEVYDHPTDAAIHLFSCVGRSTTGQGGHRG
jgi:hypothetical protein